VAVDYFKELQKAGLRLGSPAPHEDAAGDAKDWIPQFIDQAEAADIRVDFVVLHWYDWGQQPGQQCQPEPGTRTPLLSPRRPA